MIFSFSQQIFAAELFLGAGGADSRFDGREWALEGASVLKAFGNLLFKNSLNHVAQLLNAFSA